MIRTVLTLLMAAIITTGGCTTPPPAQTAPTEAAGVPLIERSRIFGNPSKVGGRISPDGQWLSGLRRATAS